jgi:hypothetical protein
MALQYSATIRNNQLDQITAAIGASGLLRIYDGTPPANVATALSGNTLLATLPLSAAAAPAAAAGVLTFNAISNDTSADATGTATFFRLLTSGGTAVAQGTVGTSGTDLIVSTTSFVATVIVSCSALTVTAGNA